MAEERPYPELPYHIAFFGRVHPRGVKISIREKTGVQVRLPDNPLILTIVPIVDNSIVAVDCYFNPMVTNPEVVIFPFVLTATRSRIDLAAFRRGVGAIVTFDWMKDHNGAISNLAIAQSDLSACCTSFDSNSNYDEIRVMAEQDEAMSLAINDLILTQTSMNTAELNCARALEGVRNIVGGQGVNPDIAWPRFRDRLNIDEQYLRLLTKKSIPRRHGQFAPIDEALQHEILRRAWTIMDRFFHYKLRGDTPLPLNEFPTLVE
jgi:hypothetical protein